MAHPVFEAEGAESAELRPWRLCSLCLLCFSYRRGRREPKTLMRRGQVAAAMAFPAADAVQQPARRTAEVLLAVWRRFALALEAYPVERIGFAALAAGVVLRLAAPFLMDFRSDGDTYTAMGHAWMLHHSFLMPYGDVTTWLPLPPGYSNH